MSHPYHGPLSAYNSLTDRHLMGYFNNTRIKRHLQRAGLITRSGRILSEKEYRINAMRRDHQKYIRDCLAQAIFHKVLDMERHHQIEIKRKLEFFARKERVQRLKVDHSRRTEEDTAPVFSPRPPAEPRSGLGTQMTAQVDSSDSSEAASSPRPNTAPGNMQRPYRLQPLHGVSSHGNAPKTSSGSRHKQHVDDHEHSFSKGVERDIWKLINTMDHPVGISPYRLPIINNFVMPAPPPTQRSPKQTTSYSSRGRRYRPTTAPNGPETSSKDSKKYHKTSLHSNVKITMRYLGKNVHLSHEDDDYRDEIKIFQQHCGGENLCVYKGRLLEDESFNLTSRRHRGFPFSLTFYINGMQVDRLSSCCEHKHRKGARLGGRNGHFGFIDIEGASPCYRCIIAMGLDKKPSPPPKKTEEMQESDSEDEKPKSPDRSAGENDVSDGEKGSDGYDDDDVKEPNPKDSSCDDADNDADMECEKGDEKKEENICTDVYETDYDEDFELENEKSEAKYNEDGRPYDEVDGNLRSPFKDEKDDLEHETESNKSSKLNARPFDSREDERDGHSESENEGGKRGERSVVEKDMNSAASKIQIRYRPPRTRQLNGQKEKTDKKRDTASSSSASSISSGSSKEESDYDSDGEETSRTKPDPEKVPRRKLSVESEEPSTPTVKKLEDENPKKEASETEIPEFTETPLRAEVPTLVNDVDQSHPSRTESRQENRERPPGSDQKTDSKRDDEPPVVENMSDAEDGLGGKTLESEEEDVRSIQEKIAEAMGHCEKMDSEPEPSDTSTDEEDTFNRPSTEHKYTKNTSLKSPEMNTEYHPKEDNSKEDKPREAQEVEQEKPEEVEMAIEDRFNEERECQSEDVSTKPEPEKEEVVVILEEPPKNAEEADYEEFTDDLLREALNEDVKADKAEWSKECNVEPEDSSENKELNDLIGLLDLEPTEDQVKEFQEIGTEEITTTNDDSEKVKLDIYEFFPSKYKLVSHTGESMSDFGELKGYDVVDSMLQKEELVVKNETGKETMEEPIAPSPSLFLGNSSVEEPEINNEMANSEIETLEIENNSIVTDETGTVSPREQQTVHEEILCESTMAIEMQVVNIEASFVKALNDGRNETEECVANETKVSSTLGSDSKDTFLNADISGEDMQEEDVIQEKEVSDVSEATEGSVESAPETVNVTEGVKAGDPNDNSGNLEESKISENEESIIATGGSGEAEPTNENAETKEESEGGKEVMEVKKEDEDLTALNDEEIIVNQVSENDGTNGDAVTEQVPLEELGDANEETINKEAPAVVIKGQDNAVDDRENVEEAPPGKDGDVVGSEGKEPANNVEPLDGVGSEEKNDTRLESRGENETSESQTSPNQHPVQDEVVANVLITKENDISFPASPTSNGISVGQHTSVRSPSVEKEPDSLSCPTTESVELASKEDNVGASLCFTEKDHESSSSTREDFPGGDNVIAGASGVVDLQKEDVSLEEVSVVQVFNLTEVEEVHSHTDEAENNESSEKETPSASYSSNQELTNETTGGDPEAVTESGLEDIENTLRNSFSKGTDATGIILIRSVEETDGADTAEKTQLVCEHESKGENTDVHILTENNISETDEISVKNTEIVESSDNENKEMENSRLRDTYIEDIGSGHENSIVESDIEKKISIEESVGDEKDKGEHDDTRAPTILTEKTNDEEDAEGSAHNAAAENKLTDEPGEPDTDLAKNDMMQSSNPKETEIADTQDDPVAHKIPEPKSEE